MKKHSSGNHSFFDEAMASGKVVSMLGFMRTGKTNFSVVLMDKALKKGYIIFCNTHFFRPEQIEEAKDKRLLNKSINYRNKPDRLNTVTTAFELLKGLHKHQLSKKQSLVFLDEAALFAGSTMGMHTRVRWLKNLIYTIGKLNASIMLIWQAKRSVIPMLREELVSTQLTIKKVGRQRNCEVARMEKGETSRIWSWYNLPETDLPYDTRAISEFVFDIDSDYLFSEVSKYNTLDMVEKFLPVLEKAKELHSIKNGNGKKKGKESMKDRLSKIMQENPNMEWSEIKKLVPELKRSYWYILRGELGIS